MTSEDLPEVRFAEYPQRSCRLMELSSDGLIDHACSLPEVHPGPCCPKTHAPSVRRRQLWERDNPGWDKVQRGADPFADFTKIKGVV